LDLQFQYPELLWLLALTGLFALLFAAYLAWKRRVAKRLGEPRLVKELLKSRSTPKTILKFSLLTLAFALGCIAVANPRKPEEGSGEARKGIDVMVALDLSNSMLATDAAPSRLQRAKELIRQMAASMPNDRMGLVVFASQAYVQVPLTYDHSALDLFVNTANPSLITAQGTAVSQALDRAEKAFTTSEERYKAVILITDGENHDVNAVAKAQELVSKGILVNTVGIGSPVGAPIIDPTTREAKKDAAGNVVISRLNEQLLREIATATKGEYVYLDQPATAAKQLAALLSTAEKKALVDTSQLNYETFYMWFALPMLLLLLAEVFFPERKKSAL
jgi:Ca-activated chloride channel homolog